jgi:hypothetical protein
VGTNKYEYDGSTNLWEGVLQEGPIVTTITAYDNAGNRASDTVIIITDTVDPAIEWKEPSFTRSKLEYIRFKWTIEDDLGIANITLEEDRIPVWTGTVGGDIETTLSPVDGAHYYTLTATDLSGRSTTVSRILIIDRSRPVIDNLTYFLEGNDLTVEWKVHDDLTGVTDIFLGVGLFSFQSSETSGTWYVGKLSPGIHIIHLHAIDGTGNSVERTLEFKIEGNDEPTGGKGALFWIMITLAVVMIIGGGALVIILLRRSDSYGADDATDPEARADHGPFGIRPTLPGQKMKTAPGMNSAAISPEWKQDRGKAN